MFFVFFVVYFNLCFDYCYDILNAEAVQDVRIQRTGQSMWYSA